MCACVCVCVCERDLSNLMLHMHMYNIILFSIFNQLAVLYVNV